MESLCSNKIKGLHEPTRELEKRIVESLLSGHPRGNGKWTLNRGWPLKRGSSEISRRLRYFNTK